MAFSRPQTRRFVFQSLYALSISNQLLPKWSEFGDLSAVDFDYADALIQQVQQQEWKLVTLIYELAPKYDIKSIPLVNLFILYIAILEILFPLVDDIPPKVALNEALELTKRYSDDPSRHLINAVLHKTLLQSSLIKETWWSRIASEYSVIVH